MFVALVLLGGLLYTYITRRQRKRRREKGWENTAEERGLTFPERNWLLLVILVAIASPLVVHWVWPGHINEQSSKTGPSTNTAKAGNDTTYHVATPPQH